MGSLSYLLKQCRPASSLPSTSSEQSHTSRDVDQAIYYLLPTLKLSYTSVSGKVALESVNRHAIEEQIKSIEADPCSPFARMRNPHGFFEPFCLKLCGVQWQRNAGAVRIRALPDAASVRFISIDGQRFEAQFLHHYPDQPRDDGTCCMLEPALLGLARPRVVYESLDQFFREIALNNQTSLNHFGRQQLLGADHFSEIFSAHEQAHIQPLLDALQPGLTSSKEL